MTPTEIRIAKKLKQRRGVARASLEEVGRVAGLTGMTVSNMERAAKGLGLSSVERVARALGLRMVVTFKPSKTPRQIREDFLRRRAR